MSAQQPFVTRKVTPLPPDTGMPKRASYEPMQQRWVDTASGVPYVQALIRGSTAPTEFGETTLTDTREGADQSENSLASDFGETVITKSREGTDQPGEITASEWGETLKTETREGVDQSEINASEWGETTKTATAEGVDQTEVCGRAWLTWPY